MTVFATLNESTQLGVDKIATSPAALALYRNLLAAFEKDATAVAAGAVLANGYIKQAMLSTTTGEVSSTGAANLTLPGGTYGFYPQSRVSANTTSQHIAGALGSTSYVTNIQLFDDGFGGGTTSFAQQRYVQASPPYDLGDGAVPLFVFALVDALGNIVSTYVAEDPPWAHNGPTDLRPDYIDRMGRPMKVVRPRVSLEALRTPALRDAELAKLAAEPQHIEITQAVKQADMPFVPHPFLFGNDLIGKTVVVLDPVGSVVERLRSLQRAGESISELLHGAYLALDNQPLVRQAPPGVMPVAVSWK